ncbi:MAG: hypothetical protein P8170_06710 [Gemmatimonadota bacterium]|jgi:hypothetical protein
MTVCLLLAALALAPLPGDGAGALHDLHVTYGNAAVEGNLVLIRLRLFKNDLEEALRRHAADPQLTLQANPATDGLFMKYVSEKFSIAVGGEELPGRIVASGEDLLDREPVWWYTLQFDAPEPVTTFRVRNTLLFELFDDQRNVVKFVHFPEETQRTYSFAEGEAVFEVRFS